jgi:hypothetical protein
MTLFITAFILLFILLTDKVSEKLLLAFLYLFYISGLVFVEIFSQNFTPVDLQTLMFNAVSFKQVGYGLFSGGLCFIIYKSFNYLSSISVNKKQA